MEKIKLNCDYCNKEFKKSPSKIRKYNFCCRLCKDIAGRVDSGEKFKDMRPNHYGDSTQYRTKALRELKHTCGKCGYNKYVEVLEVHHIDNDRNNNEVYNLEILCPTCHVEEHFINKTGKFKVKNENGL